MSENQTIAVIGSCSKQGISVTLSLLQSKKYNVRAITTHPNCNEAKFLQSRGATIVNVDMDKDEDIRKALSGSHGLFLMTLPAHGEKEYQYGKKQVDIAKEVGIKHIVFSGLENTEKLTQGKFNVPHFTNKARIEEYIRGLQGITSSFIYLGFFYTNLIQYFPAKKQEDGSLLFSLPLEPNKEYPWVDPTTAPGPIVLEMFNQPQKYAGKVIPVVNEEISMNQMVSTFSKVTGIHATYKVATHDDWVQRKLPEDMWQMFEFVKQYEYYAQKDLKESRKINPNVRTFEQFLKETNWKGESYAEWKSKNFQSIASK